MSTAGWPRTAAAPLLALLATQFAHAADAPAAVAQPAAAPPPAVGTAGQPDESSWWSTQVLAPLHEFGVESWWDVLRWEPWTGAIGFTFDNQRQRITAPNSDDQRYSSRLMNESVSIRNDRFAIIDPRLFTGTIAVGLTLQQQWQRALDASTSQHGSLTNYAFEGTALAESPYNASAVAARTQNTFVLPSGTTTSSDLRSQGVTLRVRETSILRDKEILPYFSANLRAFQDLQKETTTTAGQTFVRDDRRDLVALGFQNGTETSDLSFQYQLTRFDNFAYPDGSYRSNSTSVAYSVDFGPTLNWRSDSRVNYYSRSGQASQSDLSNLEASEILTIDHNADLSSNYNYQLTRQETPVGSATTQSAAAQVNRQLFRNLALGAGVTGQRSTLPGGTVSSTGASGSASYHHALPWQGQLSASAGGGYVVTSTDVPAGVVQVTDAPYAVPSVIGTGSSIPLRDRNIEVPTIVVVVLKNAARVPAAVDLDYTVIVEGDRTSIVPLPTSAVMMPGDPLNISYDYSVAPGSKFRTVTRSGFIGADWPWFGLNLSHDQTDQTPLSGGDNLLLVDERRAAAAVYFRGTWSDFQARTAAAFVRYDSTRLAYDERRLDQFVTYKPFSNLQLALGANVYRTDYRLPPHTTSGNAVRLDAQWTWDAWLITGYAARRSYRDTQQASEKVSEGGLHIRRSWTKLDLNVAATVQQRTRRDVTSTNGLLHIGLVRRF